MTDSHQDQIIWDQLTRALYSNSELIAVNKCVSTDLWVLPVDLVVDLHHGGPGEGEAACHKAEQRHPQGPDVHRLAAEVPGGPGVEALGRREGRGPRRRGQPRIEAVKLVTHAEVGNLDLAIVRPQEVTGLDVPVDYSLIVD